ncbi:phage-like element PBSX protein xkdM [Lachnospiraceae bacterium KM106-2]|nr:phage-like element PBSX protein xkdM [Lachnospiraceae bacterium KM106-2]
MNSYTPDRVINGTFGECWIDGEYMAETTALNAKVTLEKSEVHQTGKLTKGYKVTGIDGKGTLKLNKVSSYFINKLSENIKAGRTTTATIISKLADPDSLGSERIQLEGCTFDELTLVNWEAKKLGEESIPFTFTSWTTLDLI